jgi:translation initiation factor IF-2
MAKKRVHELAKQYDMPSGEVMKRLQAYGIEVKAAATAVDTELADAALTGKPKPKAASANGKKQQPQAAAPAHTGVGFDRPAPRAPRKPDTAPPEQGDDKDGAKGDAPKRPTRSSLQGERAPGSAGGGVRRVVIDSQASRRQGPGGPGGGPGGPGGPRRPPRRGGRRRRGTYVEPTPQDVSVLKADTIRINSGSTVKDVAEYLGVAIPEIIKKLMTLGEMATLTQTLSDDAIKVIADEFDKDIEIVHAADEADAEPVYEDAADELLDRAPVVTIMGHVDHGKTSLLDAVRQTQVAEGEAGGITQHIGAYQVSHGGKTITFLDTPGHEAFTAMRARGGQVADIAVIVVAADDGVMPQTREAIDHAKAAEVPMVVAVNKIDKEGAQPDRVRTEMTNLGLQPEEWGGETMFVDVSAKTRQNLDELMESILLVAEVEELKANPNTDASGQVIESRLDPGRGATVTVLVQRGTLRIGDAVVAGAHWGRVRAMHDFHGTRVKEAGPSEPVEVLGFDSVPEAGEFVRVVENDRKARSLAGERATRLKLEQQARRSGKKMSLETIFDQQRGALVSELNLVLKADVSGSLEAFEDEIAKLPQSEVQVVVVRSGVGGITESDVNLAAASEAVVLGFNVRPVGEAAALADREGVEIRNYSVIYRAIDELRDAMQGMLAPDEVEDTVGTAEVRAIFRASRVGTIAGSMVTDGKITRGAKVRLVRDGTVVYTGEIASLRRVDDDVREVATGFECGIVLANYADVKEGDVIEAYETRQVERKLS